MASQAATLVVTNLADTGPGSLRAILASAQNGDTINFAVTGAITNVNPPELIISNNVRIAGPGMNALAVVGNGSRIFHVTSGVTASLSDLTIRDAYAGGNGDGGGIYNAGNLALTNCAFIRCRSAQGGVGEDGPGVCCTLPPSRDGGAIYNSGALTAMNCNFLTNTASAGGKGGSALFQPGPGAMGGNAGNGGAIYSSGTMLAINCNFLANVASVGGNGGNGFGPGSPGAPGGAGGSGGAVYATGPATFIGCAFAYNSLGAGGTGGAGGSGSSARPGPGGSGGTGGSTGNGCAVVSLGQASFRSCTIANNTTPSGGTGGGGGAAYFNIGGRGGNGGTSGSGALYCPSSAEFIACTLTANTAGRGGNGGSGGAGGQGAPGGNGGSGGAGGTGGAVYGNNSPSSNTLQNVIVAGNSPGWIQGAPGGSGGGPGASGAGWSGPAGTSGTNGAAGAGGDLYGAFTSRGHNLIGLRTGSTGFTNNVLNDLVGTNNPIFAALAPLAQNGGPTLTCAPFTASPAINAGDDTLLANPLNIGSDGRGFPRLSGSHVDIGAYELQWPTTPFLFSGSTSNGVFVLTHTNVPGILYLRVLGASTPTGGWGLLGTMSEVTPGEYQWIDSSLTNNMLRFFRLRSP